MYFNLYLHIAQYFLSDGLSSIYGAIGVEHVRVGRVATPEGSSTWRAGATPFGSPMWRTPLRPTTSTPLMVRQAYVKIGFVCLLDYFAFLTR
jgi:hypothetical protein